MSGFTITTAPSRCSNLYCSNKVGEGQFVFVEHIGVPKAMALHMCSPCANALVHASSPKGPGKSWLEQAFHAGCNFGDGGIGESNFDEWYRHMFPSDAT